MQHPAPELCLPVINSDFIPLVPLAWYRVEYVLSVNAPMIYMLFKGCRLFCLFSNVNNNHPLPPNAPPLSSRGGWPTCCSRAPPPFSSCSSMPYILMNMVVTNRISARYLTVSLSIACLFTVWGGGRERPYVLRIIKAQWFCLVFLANSYFLMVHVYLKSGPILSRGCFEDIQALHICCVCLSDVSSVRKQRFWCCTVLASHWHCAKSTTKINGTDSSVHRNGLSLCPPGALLRIPSKCRTQFLHRNVHPSIVLGLQTRICAKPRENKLLDIS